MNVLIELLNFKHVHYCSKKGKNDFYDKDSGAEAEDDKDARVLEGRAIGSKARVESQTGLVLGLAT